MRASWAGLIFVLVAAAVLALLVIGSVYVVVGIVRWLLATVAGLMEGPGAGAPERAVSRGRSNLSSVCANTRCRRVNPPGAKFCAQCGQRL